MFIKLRTCVLLYYSCFKKEKNKTEFNINRIFQKHNGFFKNEPWLFKNLCRSFKTVCLKNRIQYLPSRPASEWLASYCLTFEAFARFGCSCVCFVAVRVFRLVEFKRVHVISSFITVLVWCLWRVLESPDSLALLGRRFRLRWYLRSSGSGRRWTGSFSWLVKSSSPECSRFPSASLTSSKPLVNRQHKFYTANVLILHHVWFFVPTFLIFEISKSFLGFGVFRVGFILMFFFGKIF